MPAHGQGKGDKMILLKLAAGAVAALLGCGLLVCADSTVEQAGPAAHPRWNMPQVAVEITVSQLALALFLPLYYGVGWTDLLRTLLMLAILWPCAWADAQVCLIPNRVLALGSLLGVALLGGEILYRPGQIRYQVLRVIIAAVALLLTALICRLVSPRAVGMGDVKILAVMGFCLGMDLVWPALFFSFMLLFGVCVFLLITRRAKRTDSIPFAPFLLAGTLLAAFLTGI